MLMASNLYASSLLCVLTLAAASGGCARYEYDLISPQELARHIPAKTFTEAIVEQPDAPPLRYEMTSYDNRLVLRIHNPGDEPIRLLGDQSTAVDPDGQSHPLRGQTIAAGTFVKLVLPPTPPQIVPSGPRFGIGIGGAFGGGRHFRRGYGRRAGYGYGLGFGSAFDDPWYDSPRYYTVQDDGSGLYWNWEGETPARLILVFQVAQDKPFTHEFTFRRKKV